MKSIVVTGASTGIGWGCVKVLTGKGFHVFGSVRKQADADRLQQEFGAAFTPLIFDVTDEAAVAAGARTVAEKLNGLRQHTQTLGHHALGRLRRRHVRLIRPRRFQHIDLLNHRIHIRLRHIVPHRPIFDRQGMPRIPLVTDRRLVNRNL